MGQSKSIYFWCLHTKECTQTELGRVYPCWMEQSWLSQSFSIRRSSDGCKSSTLLAAESKAIEKGSSIAFRQGPSLQQKKARSHHQELARVVQLGKDIVSLSNFQIDPNSGHRPPLAKKMKQYNKRHTKKKNEQNSSQQPFTCSQDAHTFMQQPSVPTPTHVIQLQNATDVTDDQSQLNQISSASYSPQPVCVQASSPRHSHLCRSTQ